jgi:hypothetical protein
MKKLFFIMILSSWAWADCPLWTYPENHKLDSEINNLCQQIQNPVGNQLAYSSGTFTSLSASTGTFNQINMKGNKIINVANGTASTDATAIGQLKIVQITSGTSTTAFTTNNTAFQTTNCTAQIKPTSASNAIIIVAMAPLVNFSCSTTVSRITIARGGTNIYSANGLYAYGGTTACGAAIIDMNGTLVNIDAPASTSLLTYAVQLLSSDGVTSVQYGRNGAQQVMWLMEVVMP